MTGARRAGLWGAGLAVYAAVLCALPLFDVLAFEFAFAVAIPLTWAGGLAGVRARAPGVAPLTAWRRGGLWATGLALVPLLPITLNGLRVQNCAWGEGLLIYLLLPVAGAWVGAGWGAALARTRAPRLAFAAVWVGSVVWGVAVFWMFPPVDVFNPFLGYWPGALYDEVFEIEDRLWWSRLEDLSFAALAVAVAALRRDRRRVIALAAALVGALGAHGLARRADVHRDAAHLQARLGGTLSGPHIVLHHPAEWPPETAASLLWDLEFAHTELRAFFERDTTRPVHVYAYPSDAVKKRLMGARRTNIAKPWQWTVHLNTPQVGDAVSLHELAHVFSAEIAAGPHHLSLYRGLVPHMPLIEGLAEAATWQRGRLDLHEWSAAMRRIGKAPPLAAVLEPAGFYARHGRTAYTLVGSFTRYFRDREGPAALAEAYRAGTFAVGGRDVDRLVADWEAMLDGLELPEAALANAEARFDRPAIFAKVCAREMAALRRGLGRAMAAADLAGALEAADRMLAFVAGEVGARLARVHLLHALGRREAARGAAEALAADGRAGAVVRARAREWLADLAADAGDAVAARAGYRAARATAFDRDEQRRLAVKAAALDAGEAGRAARALLLAPPGADDAWVDGAVAAVEATEPAWPIARYLAARRQAARGDLAAAWRALDGLDATLPDASLRLEAARLRAEVAFRGGCPAAAAPLFDALAERADLGLTPAERHDLRRWGRRARFFAEHAGARCEVDIDPAGHLDAGSPE